MLWDAQLLTFARTVEYWPRNDSSAWFDLQLIWREGVEGEERSPGRYSHATVRNSDIPDGPARGDAVVKDGIEYDVVRVDAMIYGWSDLVLQDRTETF
jgi:hypothetical protein